MSYYNFLEYKGNKDLGTCGCDRIGLSLKSFLFHKKALPFACPFRSGENP
jgi:hypothetical protein